MRFSSVVLSAALLAPVGAVPNDPRGVPAPPPAADRAGRAPVEITEWTVPWANTRPRDPYVDASGRVWFVGQTGDYVAYLEPASGQFRRFELDRGTGPHNLVVDARGQVWYAGNRTAHIGRLDPSTGRITKYPMPDSAARDPHTLTFDAAGRVWFTVQGGNRVGTLDPATGRVRLVEVPTPGARPYGIVVAPDGTVWFNQFGTNKVGAVNPATLALREYTLPNERARGRRIALPGDGGVWYVDYTRGYLSRLDPATGAVREWAAPGGAGSLPYALTSDDRGRLWLVETGQQPNRLVGFDPRTEHFTSVTPIKSGGGTVRHMVFHRPSRELWFGTDVNTIARARVE